MNHTSRTLAALTGAAGLTLAGTTPASAAVWSHGDAAGDVQSYTWDERKGTESGPDPEPANTDTDLIHLGAEHKSRRVVLTASLRDITEASGMVVYRIKTGKRAYDAVQRLGTNREMGPAFGLFRRDGRVRCSGARHAVDRTAEQATVSIPRSCLDRPRWVRVGAGAVSYSETRTSFTYLFDDALRTEGEAFENPALGPRIRRG